MFKEATTKRNLSTLLYEDPDAVAGISLKDRELIKQLNAKVSSEPDYPVPEGFVKIKEKVPVYRYEIPEAMRPVIGEARSTAIEIVDDLLSKLYNVHVIEPIYK